MHLKAKNLEKIFLKFIEAFKTGDFSKILSTAFVSFLEVKKDILDYVNDEPELLDKPCKNVWNVKICSKGCPLLGGKRGACIDRCVKKYC